MRSFIIDCYHFFLPFIHGMYMHAKVDQLQHHPAVTSDSLVYHLLLFIGITWIHYRKEVRKMIVVVLLLSLDFLLLSWNLEQCNLILFLINSCIILWNFLIFHGFRWLDIPCNVFSSFIDLNEDISMVTRKARIVQWYVHCASNMDADAFKIMQFRVFPKYTWYNIHGLHILLYINPLMTWCIVRFPDVFLIWNVVYLQLLCHLCFFQNHHYELSKTGICCRLSDEQKIIEDLDIFGRILTLLELIDLSGLPTDCGELIISFCYSRVPFTYFCHG